MTTRVTREDQIGYLADRALRELRRELKKRLKAGLVQGVFPVHGHAIGPGGEILVAMEWKP